jgi:16S rRNA (adenine1518-N6/adenine1519-N6)-dimethyltransferase
MCFTIQRELGERMLAVAGHRDFGPLAIAMQTACTIVRIARLSGSVFWPPPNVESVMLQMTRRPHPFQPPTQLTRFLNLVHAAFAHRRKTLRYNLARVLSEPQLSAAAGIVDLAARAESIPLATWHALGTALLDPTPGF